MSGPTWRIGVLLALAIASCAPRGAGHRERPARLSVAPVATRVVASLPIEASLPSEPGRFAPAFTRTKRGSAVMDGRMLAGDVVTCAPCHAEIAAQWRASAHAFASFNNPIYRVSVEDFRKATSNATSRFCAGCHDPALLLDGAMDAAVDPRDPRANSGVSCLVCHSIDDAARDGNGSYRLRTDDVVMPIEGDAASLKAHRERLAMPALQTTELCGACHRAFLGADTGHGHHMPGADDYGAWLQSVYAGSRLDRIDDTAPEPRDCRGCHMAAESAPRGDAAAERGHVASHRFTGGHSWLAAMRGDQEQLAKVRENLVGAASIDVAAVRYADGRRALPAGAATVAPGSDIEFEVVVRNQRTGHNFPGGTLDAQDTWIEVVVDDALGRRVALAGSQHRQSGSDPTAHRLRAALVDERGRVVLSRRVHAFRAKAYDHTIAARDRALVRYSLAVPRNLRAEQLPLRVTARLLHRSRELQLQATTCESAGGDALDSCAPQPIITVARGSTVLDGTARPTSGARLLDHGSGWLHALSEQVEAARPSLLAALARFDGDAAGAAPVLLSLARLEARQGRVADAQQWIARVDPTLQRHPAVAWLMGRALAAVWRHDDAVPWLSHAARGAPHDARAWAALATAEGSAASFFSALASARTGLAFAPRQPDLLRVQALALQRLSSPDRLSRQAFAAFLAHRRRDDAPQMRSRCSSEVAGCALERTPVHQHRLVAPVSPRR